MSTGEDEPTSGFNARLRPRKSIASPKTTTALQKLDPKPLNERPKRTSTPSKTSLTKPDDLPNKIEVSPVSQVPCSYCDKTFVNRQAVAKHTKRVHTSTTKPDISFQCLFCNHEDIEPNGIFRHMIDSHPNQYFACLNCISRFSSTIELAEHKLNVCEKQKPHYRSKLRQKSPKKTKSQIDGRQDFRHDDKDFSEVHGYNGIVISCELKPVHVHDEADIEDNITTNLILPTSKNLGNATVIEKNAVIVLDDLQWNKRLPPNFNFHTTDADQILSRLGVVHRGPRTGEPNRRDWLKIIDETNQKFERCFETSFYSKVASNVQENLAKFLDGSCNFNPDPDNTIKTRKSKNSVAINTAEGFPILLAFEQYSRNVVDGYMPRSIAPRHKWKWDNIEHDKTLMSPEQIKRDSHANNCIITLVSSLDIWTQLCMRQKFEDKFRSAPLEKKAEKQNIIAKELKEILEKRELPEPSSQVVKYANPAIVKLDELEFPASLGLAPAVPNHDIKPAILSGEWVRPRCYICCACGSQARDSRALSSHITTQHPNAQIQHYEIVGERLLNSDISKHLYVPPSQVNNRTRPLRGYRECTKCKRSVTLEDLHQHMLDCAGDTPTTVRRKCRTARPFGVRKRRARLPDNTIRKKIRKDIRSRHRKNLIRPRQKNRSDVGDAETIRKMLADLPAKRHRVLVNPLNSNLRPRRKFEIQRNKLKIKKSVSDDGNKKGQVNISPLLANVGKERLSKKSSNLKDGDSRTAKSNMNQMPIINRHNNISKRKSPLKKTKNIRFKESKGSSNQGGEGRKCSDSGKNTDSNQSGSGNSNESNSGEGAGNSRGNGNQSNSGSNGRDNQQPGSSRQNDNNRDSSGQPPNEPLKHSIARLTARTGTHDKAVQFHHLFLVQQECNNIPHHVPSRQRVLFENEAVVTKLDKPPLHFNHGGTMDPMTQKSKLSKPRKGLNDCIDMLRNKLVEPSSTSHKQVASTSIQCKVDLESTRKNDKPMNLRNPLIRTCKVTHEIAVQCADLDSDESLAQILIKQRLARQAAAAAGAGGAAGADSAAGAAGAGASATAVAGTAAAANAVVTTTAAAVTATNTTAAAATTTTTTTASSQKGKGKGKSKKGKALEKKNEKLIKESQKKNEGEIINNSDAVENKPAKQEPTLKEKSCVQQSTIEKSIPSDTKGSLDDIKTGHENIPITKTQSTNLNTEIKNREKEEIKPIRKTIDQTTKYESKSPVRNDSESDKMNSKTSSPKENINIKQTECENKSNLIDTKKQNNYVLPVNHDVTETVDKPLVSYEQHEVINIENVNPKISVDDDKVCNTNPIPQDLSIQDVRQDLSINDHSEIESHIPPAHCNIQMESILTVPLDLSGRISSTQCDSPVPYVMSVYDDNYETLDLSNKNPNRDVTVNSTFINEDVVDLRVKYATQIHYESDLSISSIPDEATDLSLGNEQVPKDLSLKGKNYNYSRVSAMTNNEYVDIGSGRSHYNFSGSNMYEDSSCPDCSINVQNNIPTDLSARRDSRFEPAISHVSGTENGNCVERNDIHASDIATNLSLVNRMEMHVPINDISIRSYETYEELTDEITHCGSQMVSPIIIAIDTENVTKKVFDTAINLLQQKSNNTDQQRGQDYNTAVVSSAIDTVGTGVTLISSKDLSKDHFSPAITSETAYMDMSKINHQPTYTKESVSPYPCISESITTSLPDYNYKNHTLVTTSSKYESTTPVYTLANACISVTKIETSSTTSLTNMLLSIPGNTITNATSVYTLAGTTIGTPLNYISGQRSLPASNETSQVYKSTKNITDLGSQNPEVLNKPIPTNSKDEDKVQDKIEIGAESFGTNVEQDPDIDRKIALLPKELVEILGTMPLDHRKQLLNVLPHYVSTSTASKTFDQNFQPKSVTPKNSVSPNFNTNETNQTKLQETLEKRHNLLNPTPPPSTLSISSAELSPTSISSSILLTPPTPNFKGRQFIKAPRDNKTNSKILLEENIPMSADIDLITKNHLNIIDLTGDDNSQPMPEVEVHRTSEVSVQSFTSNVTDMSSAAPKSIPKTNNDKTSSLRAVRIKTQSERQRSAFPEIKTRNNSIKIPVTSLHPDDTKIKLDSNKSLTIQQGEITSSQYPNKNTIDCEISSSVSINNEHVFKKKYRNKLTENEVLLQHTVVEKSYGSGIPGHSKKCDGSSTNVKNDDSNSSSVSLAALSTPIQSETIISDNNNVFLKCKNGGEEIKIQDKHVTTNDDDDSDDDVSLAAIVKQRNRDKTVDKTDTQSDSKRYGKYQANANLISSSITTAKIVIDMSTEVTSANDKSSEQSNLLVPKNTVHQSQNDKLNIETKDKNKKKVRKGRRNISLNIAKIIEQPINDEFDINKENNVTSESENMKHKDDNIKQKPVEIESGCVSSFNNEKDPVCTNIPYKEKIHDKTELSDEKNLIERDAERETADSLKIVDVQERAVIFTYDKTLNKSSSHKSMQDNVNRIDLINLQNRPLIPRVIPRKIDINSSVSNGLIENTATGCDLKGKFTPTSSTATSHENEHIIITTKTITQEQNTVTSLRRSTRGKSLFIDSNVTSKEPNLPADVVPEHKMPLTKKQLIFSKLLLDEEHNVIPYNPSNIEKIINNQKSNQAAQDQPKIDQNFTIQNYDTNSEDNQQISQSAIKTNKRKKLSQTKKKNKKKKVQQNHLSNENIFLNLPLNDGIRPKSIDTIEAPTTVITKSYLHMSAKCSSGTNQDVFTPNKSKELDNKIGIDTINSSQGFQKKSGSIEKRKPDLCTDNVSSMSSSPKKSKGNDNNVKLKEVLPKKVLVKPDTTTPDNKTKARMTCYNKSVATKRVRSKSVFVNSSDYYDPYDIDLEEMNEISESMNQKISIRKPKCMSTLNEAETDSKRLAECYEAVPSTSKSVTINLVQFEKHEWLREFEHKELKTQTTSDNKDTISDSDDSSKSDVPLKKYVEEKERKMLDRNANLNKIKRVINSDVKMNTKTRRKKGKRSIVLNSETGVVRTRKSESEAHLRSEQFMESFGFFSVRKPRKSNLLATKKISETLNIIANETDDVYFGRKERSNKKTAGKRHLGVGKSKGILTQKATKQDKKPIKCSQKEKVSTFDQSAHCQLCKKDFLRMDNYTRHQVSDLHIAKLLDRIARKNTTDEQDEPNYLLAYLLQFNKVLVNQQKDLQRQIHSLPTSDLVIPTFEETVADTKKAMQEQQIYCRGLSKDEALFIDCCELLRGSHVQPKPVAKVQNSKNLSVESLGVYEWFLRKIYEPITNYHDKKIEGNVDAITALNILDSEEVRILEKELISGLQVAAELRKKLNNQKLRETLSNDAIQLPSCSLVTTNDSQLETQDKAQESKNKPKRSPEYKEKMYPDIIETIDMFEDKFDKIKRKCRSQAAAASKQSQAVPVPEASSSQKVRKSKKKGKKKIKTRQNTVMTKGALKGFDGVKVSLVTTDMSAITPPAKKSPKKKKKNQSKKKRERKSSEVNTKTKDRRHDESPQKKIDVYEFMDTEDAEVFDFRPSTIMERFKSISNKEIPSTSKSIGKYNEAEISSDSASDGDDFVYMSDDYVCSEDETENSIMSCELKNVNEQKKCSPQKRKEATEKNTVMGKIFKHNAVRSDKKNTKNKDIEKPKANLDQLFDSLLEEQPHSSKHVNEIITSVTSEFSSQQFFKTASPKQPNKSDYHEYDTNHRDHGENNLYITTVNLNTSVDTDKVTSSSTKRQSITPPKMCNISPSKITDEYNIKNANDKPIESEVHSTQHDVATLPESVDESNSDDLLYNPQKSKNKSRDKSKIKSSLKSHDKEKRVSFNCQFESLDVMDLSDDAGVARQRVRRKCTVGKQNVLAESWSSESEPDGMPPRPNSVESVSGGISRRRKGRKKEGHSSGNKKKINKIVKRNDFESRVNSRIPSCSEVYEHNAGSSRCGNVARGGGFARPGPSFTAHASTSSSSCVISRPRPPSYYWSEGEDEQEHLQQHGWIVGDSHKKLVTMLAHAKGRKRNNDEKRHVVE